MIQPMPGKHTAPMRAVRLLLAACLSVAAPATGGGTAFAADGPETESAPVAQPQPPRDRPDFLFGQPRRVIGLSTGWLRASAGGLLGSFREYLIRGVDAAGQDIPFGDRPYDTVLLRFAGGYSLTPRVDLVFDATVSKSTTASEYRDWLWEGRRPIAQTTEVQQRPVNLGVRYWVLPRGRRIGRLAWIPNTLAFHVGVGVGTRWYALDQTGDFLDFETLDIFADRRLHAQGFAFSRHVSAGVSLRMTRQIFAVAEVRRVWSQNELALPFVGVMDLNALQMTAGIEHLW